MSEQEPNSADTSAVNDISARLSADASSPTNDTASEAPQAAEPTPFDLSKLSLEQLQQLKAMLNSTPDRVAMKQANPIIQLRRYQGKLVIDFKDAILTLQRDEYTNISSEVMMLPVKYLGEQEFVNVPWREFMNAEQIKCEVTNIRKVEGRIVEGQVVSKETGRLVEREVKTVQHFFTVKLPEWCGVPEIEVEAKVVNA